MKTWIMSKIRMMVIKAFIRNTKIYQYNTLETPISSVKLKIKDCFIDVSATNVTWGYNKTQMGMLVINLKECEYVLNYVRDRLYKIKYKEEAKRCNSNAIKLLKYIKNELLEK